MRTSPRPRRLRLTFAAVSAALVAVLTAAGCGDGGFLAPVDRQEGFVPPIEGAVYDDIFYGAYVDQGARDYDCGEKFYEGHAGVDILIPNFQAMDVGVPVVAAAPGAVTRTRDGFFDRSAERGSGGFGNAVWIAHDDGLETIYGHLREGSLAVESGDVVGAGDFLGFVGSSGNSNWPHLHFEVRGVDGTEEPFQGECGSAESLWRDQLPYQDSVLISDGGITDIETLSLAALLERPPDLEEVSADRETVRYWIQLVNGGRRRALSDVIDPDGQLVVTVDHGDVFTYSMRFLGLEIPVSGFMEKPGTWTIRTRLGGAIAWSRELTVLEPPLAAERMPAPGAEPEERPQPEARIWGRAGGDR